MLAGKTFPLAALTVALYLLLQPSLPAQQSGAAAPGTAEYQVDQNRHAPAASRSGYVMQEDVMVRMRDGVALATDIYLPAAQGAATEARFPVLVYRTPYNKDGLRRSGIFFAQHGFVVVAQDCRGRFASQGKFNSLVTEGPDGFDTIEWAARQPWSNGKIGTAGASYEGWVQYTAALLAPPHLVTMFPVVAWGNFYESSFAGGIPSLSMSLWDLFMASTSQEARRLPSLQEKLATTFKKPDSWQSLPPLQRGQIFQSLPQYEKLFQRSYQHPRFDRYWRQPGLFPAGYYGQFKDVPMYFISGWYDGTVGGVIRNDVELAALQKSPKRLMVGPWPHGTGSSTCGDAYFGPSAAIDEQDLQLDWFNHWLKSEPYKILSGAPVRIFEMGGGANSVVPPGKLNAGGRWIALDSWPPPTTEKRLYLDKSGGLTDAPSRTAGPTAFLDDPAHPVPTRGGYFHGDCIQNQAELEKRPDVLTFTTPVLKEPVSIMGTVEAHLFISSTAPDTDFIAKLVDVYPNGYSMIVGEGELRARYRNGPDQLSLLNPGDVYALIFPLGPTSNLFAAGHRIRLDISSTDFPRLEPNPNTAADPSQWTTTAIARNAVYSGGSYSSYVALPVLKQNAASH